MAGSTTLTREQYDIAWHDLELGDQPYPISILTHGKTYDERAVIRRRVYGELTALRLANGRRLDPDLADSLALIARSPVRLEMAWLPERAADQMRNAIAVRTGETGLIAELTERSLVLTPARGTAIVYELLGLLPKNGAAPGQSISLPVAAITSAGAGGGRHAAPGQGESIYDTRGPAGGPGPARQQVRALEALFSTPRVCGGNIEVTVLDRHGRRTRSRPIEWFDTEEGRCMAQFSGAEGEEHLTVTPADNNKIVSRLHEVIDRMMGAPPA